MPVKTCTNSSPDNSARKDLEMKPVDMRRAILDRGNLCTSYATLRFPQLGKKQVFLILPPKIYDIPQTEKGWAMFLRRRLERK